MGLIIGAEAAKTGSFLIRVGGEAEELSLAEIEGRNVTLLREDWDGESEVRHQPLIEEVDIVHGTLELSSFIPICVIRITLTLDNESESWVNESFWPCR